MLALAAKSSQDKADITIQLKDGNVALFQVPGKSGAQVRGKVQAFLVAKGVPCLDDAPVATEPTPVPTLAQPQAPVSAADEIAEASRAPSVRSAHGRGVRRSQGGSLALGRSETNHRSAEM